MTQNRLPTRTRVTLTGNNVEIFTFYEEDVVYQKFRLLNVPENINQIDVLEGELVYQYEGTKDDFFIDNEGNLIVLAEDPGSYTLNSNGELIKTEA